MKKVISITLLALFISCTAWAQLEIVPRTAERPALLRTDNSAHFSLGLQEKSVLNISSNGRVGLGTEYTSNGVKLFPQFAKLHIRHNSSGAWSEGSGSAHLLLDEDGITDYARLRFRNSRIYPLVLGGYTYLPDGRYWDIAGRGYGGDITNDRLHFYNSDKGNILSIAGDGKVGINNSNPGEALDVSGSAKVTGFSETGELSIPHKTKLIAFTSLPFSCGAGATYNFSLGVNESRVISADVLVQTGTSSFYPPNDWFNNREYSYRIDGFTIYFEFKAVSGCDFSPRGFRVWLTYSDAAIPMPTGNGP